MIRLIEACELMGRLNDEGYDAHFEFKKKPKIMVEWLEICELKNERKQ